MSCPSYPPRLDYSNYTWRRVQMIWNEKLLLFTTPLKQVINGIHCPSGRNWGKRHLLSLQRTQTRLLIRPAGSLVTVSTELSRLLVYGTKKR
jgi:hypothetical protein